MFDERALRRAKAMLVRQGAGLLLQDASEAHVPHSSTCEHTSKPPCDNL